MKKFTTMLVLAFVFCATSTYAQMRQISGTVVSSEDNSPIIGATVILKGTSQGDVTNHLGEFTISNAQGAVVLEVAYLGYKTQEVEVPSTVSKVNIKLSTDALSVSDIVVTGLGISREKKALGYAVQEVGGDELSKARTGNVVSALSGRVAGVQIRTASGQMGGGAKINVRGNTSLTGSNQPLFVVDGVPISNESFSSGERGTGGYDLGNFASDINPDDIESMSVLKGAGATAIYGSRGANGVVLITTKKAKKSEKKTFGVSVNSSVTIDTPGIMPKLQNMYGGGFDQKPFETAVINGTEYNLVNYSADQSWGPKFDPNTKVLKWNAFDSWDKENYLNPTPWVYPENDYHSYFENGVGTTNNIQIQGANDGYTYRLSYTNLYQTGITPGAQMTRNTVSFNGTADINKFIDSWVAVNYVGNKAQGRPETGYGDRNPAKAMWQWSQTQLDYEELKAYVNPDGTQRPWNRKAYNNASPEFADNPYWSSYRNYQSDRRDRVYGNAGVNINLLNNKIKITGRGGMDMYRFKSEERMAAGSAATSQYVLMDRFVMETNFDLFGTYNDRYADNKMGLSVMFGTSSNDRKYDRTGGYTDGGLVIPGIYDLLNSVNKARVYSNETHKRINSIYGNVTLDYKQLIYLDITGRNDWSSTLPADNRSYFYPSFNLSFIISELPVIKEAKWLSFAKLRGGWSEVGNDTDPYKLMSYYTSDPSFDGNPMYFKAIELNNANLKPERTDSWEVGLEASFFKRRLSFDVAYFDKRSFDQIVPITVSGATGYSTSIINAGEMTNKGFEVMVSATPISTKSGFKWDIAFNFATLKNRVESILPGIDFINFGTNGFNIKSGAFVGQSYPIIYGTDYVYNENGDRLITPGTPSSADAAGVYQKSNVKDIGNATPKFTAGLSTSFAYKGFDVSVLFDMQLGGQMYFQSYMFGMNSGMMEESAQETYVDGKWANIRDHGILLDGVYGTIDSKNNITYTDAQGNPTDEPVRNTSVTTAVKYGESHYAGVDAQNVFSTDFIKLREIRVAYTFPMKWTGPIKDIRLSFFGRNLATWMKDNQHFDPEYLQDSGSNSQGVEGGYIPSARTYGVGLSFNF